MSWATKFEDPVPVTGGTALVTLEDAAAYIQRLPKAEQDLKVWQTATGILIGAAEGREPLMHARIAMLQAIRRDRPKPPPRQKRAKAFKILR